jgi:Zn-dependent peptidase ImmA (M78 family)
LYDQLETEATTVAALVLLPKLVVTEPVLPVLELLANFYQVPSELVLIRKVLYQETGF